MKVHIVTYANKARYADALAEMHRQRHRLFVEEKGWKALHSANGHEADEYDDRHAVYLLAIEDSELRGSARLLPSWRRSLTKDHLSRFIMDDPLTGPDIWEWTRWVPGDTRHPRKLIQSRKLLMLAGLEFGLSRNADAFTAVCDCGVVTQLIELGWAPKPLGLPTRFAEGTATAITWAISVDLLCATRKVFRVEGPVSIETPPHFGDASIQDTLMASVMASVAEIASPQALAEAASTLIQLVRTAGSYPSSPLKFAGARQ